MKTKLTSLNVIDVAAPCPANWEAMTGDDRVRHCSQCEMNVYNLSEMTEREALQLVNQHEGRLCIQFYRRADGTMLTKNCPVGLKAIRKAVRRKITRLWASTAAVAGAIFFGGIVGRSCQAEVLDVVEIDPKLIEVVKGKVCVSPQPLLTYDGLKMMDAKTVKQYLHRCLTKEEQASYGMPDPDNKNALEEGVRQSWQAKVEDASYLPQRGTNEHNELSKITAELLKKHSEIALQILAPQLRIDHAVRGRMTFVPHADHLPE